MALPIGGLKREKSLAAARSGIKEIIVPEENRKGRQLNFLRKSKRVLKISYMKCVDDALAIALVHPKA
jgi:ATP-dependent Lon protease